LILGTYSKFARENNFLALGVFFPQPCSSAGCRFAASGHVYKTADESFRFHNKNFDEVHRNWIPLRIRVRLKNTQPHLKVLKKYIKVGLGISRTNKESQWISFYKSFHQILVEINKLVDSNPNVILMRQTCGQRSSMPAGGKRRALAFYISIRICYMFLIYQNAEESPI